LKSGNENESFDSFDRCQQKAKKKKRQRKDNKTMTDLEQYKRKGYLHKEGALFTLKKRYFVLSPHEYKLYWAADATTERALGAIDLVGTSVDVYTTSNKSRRFAFRIRQMGQVVATLVAPDAVARDDWMMAISAVVHGASLAQVSSDKIGAASVTTHFDVVDGDVDADDDADSLSDAPDADRNNFKSHSHLARSVPTDDSKDLDHRRDRRRRSFDQSAATATADSVVTKSSSSSSATSRKSASKATSPSSSRSAAASSSRSRPRPQSVSFSTAQLQSALTKSRELVAAESPPSVSTSSSSSAKWSAKRMSLPFANQRRPSGDDTHNDHDMKSADGADAAVHDDSTAASTVAAAAADALVPTVRSSKSGKSSKAKAKAATLRNPSTVSAADHTDGMLDVLTPRVEVKRASASSSLSSSPAALTPAPTTPAPKPAPPVSSLSLSSIETPRPSGVAPAPPTGNRRRALTAVNGEPAPDPSTKASTANASSTMDPRSLRIALAKKELLEEIAEERAAAAGASSQPTTPLSPTAAPSPAALRALSTSPTPLAPPHSSSPSRGMLESGSSRKVISPANSGHIGAGSGNVNRGLRNSPVPVANAQEELVLTPREKARREKSLDIQKRMFQAVVSESKGRKLLTDEGKVIFDPSDDDSQQSPAPPRRAAPRSGERRRSSSFSAHQATTSWPTVNLDESPRTPKGAAPPPAETMTIDGAGSDSDDSEVDFTAPSKPSPAAISAASGVAINHSDDGSDALDDGDDDDDDAPLPPPTSAPVDSPRVQSPMKKPPPPSAPLFVPKPPATPPMAPRASLSGSGAPPPLPATPEQPRRSLSTSGKVSSLVARFSSSNSEPRRASASASATPPPIAAAPAVTTVPPPPPGPPPSD
jgi:hypothetical protein